MTMNECAESFVWNLKFVLWTINSKFGMYNDEYRRSMWLNLQWIDCATIEKKMYDNWLVNYTGQWGIQVIAK